MKQILLLALLCCALGVSAQSVERTEEYADIQVASAFGKTFISGDKGSGFNFDGGDIKDAEGNAIKVKGIADALNYMNGQGWTLLTTYTDSKAVHFILHRPFKK